MKRTFKFRAWDTKNKQWMQSVPPREYMIDSDEWDRRDCDDGSGEGCLFFPNNPIGSTFDGRIVYTQYIEKSDKNGKEMYDGDILRLVNGKTGWVSYSVEVAGYIFNGVISDEPQDGELVTASLSYVRPSESEIIGNIFENPELK